MSYSPCLLFAVAEPVNGRRTFDAGLSSLALRFVRRGLAYSHRRYLGVAGFLDIYTTREGLAEQTDEWDVKPCMNLVPISNTMSS